jgi:hypothetical protein
MTDAVVALAECLAASAGAAVTSDVHQSSACHFSNYGRWTSLPMWWRRIASPQELHHQRATGGFRGTPVPVAAITRAAFSAVRLGPRRLTGSHHAAL